MAADLIYAVTSDVDPALDPAFNHWYDGEHVVELLAVPGFTAARRFRAIEGAPRYLAVYDLAEIEVLESYAFQRIRPTHPDSTQACREMWSHVRNWNRAAYEQIAAGGEDGSGDGNRAGFLFLAGYRLDPAHDEEFGDWYAGEHLPLLVEIPGVVRTRCFRLHPKTDGHVLGEPPRCVVLCDLANAEVSRSAPWQRAQRSPWAARLQRRSKTPMRNLYQRIFPK